MEIDDFDETILISNVKDIEGLKQYANDVLAEISDLFDQQMKLLESISTINDLIKLNIELQINLGETLGYNYGMIDASLNGIFICMKNLTKISTGEYDNTDPAALEMFISIWRQIALAEVKTVHEGLNELELIEVNIIGDGSNKIIMGQLSNNLGTVH